MAIAWKRGLALLALICALQPNMTLAVTADQINNAQARIQNVRQTIRGEETRVANLEKDSRYLDQQIFAARKLVRDERLAGRKQVFDTRRELKLQEFEIERIEKDIALVDFDIEVIERDVARDQQRFQELNLLKQGLEKNEFEKRQEEYRRQRAALEAKKAPLIDELAAASAKSKQLQELVSNAESEADDATLDKDSRVASLVQKRERTNTELANLRGQLRDHNNQLANLQQEHAKLSAEYKRQLAAKPVAKPAPQVAKVAPAPAPAQTTANPAPALDRTDYSSYVFVISGTQEPDIEQTLHLKTWVESYGAKYIQANWNGFDAANPQSSTGFKDAFRNYLRQIPANAKLVLIGHGLGGGTAIEAATEVAFAESRTIDFLAVLDPIGDKNLRANIVYSTAGTGCAQPDAKNEMTNAEYIECIKSAKKRLITGNIRYFYNRWQKDAEGPLDFQREIPSLDRSGKVVSVPTATGRFDIAENTGSDQKRLYFAGDKNAHKLLLSEEAKQLPKLLVQHLR